MVEKLQAICWLPFYSSEVLTLVVFQNSTQHHRPYLSLACYACAITLVLVRGHPIFAETPEAKNEPITAQKILAEASAMIPEIPDEEIGSNSKNEKVLSLGRIAELQGKVRDQSGLKKTADRAIQIAGAKGNQAYGLFTIVSAQVYNGFLEDGKQTLEAGIAAAMSLEKKYQDVHLLNFVAPLTKVGEVSRAIKIANSIQSPFWRANALIKLGYALIEDGKPAEATKIYDQAYRLVTSIEKPESRAAMLRFIASGKFEMNNLSEATKILEEAWQVGTTVEKLESKISTLSLIALGQETQGNHQRAKEMLNQVMSYARSVKELKTRIDVYETLAFHQLDAAHQSNTLLLIEEAMALIQQLESPKDKAWEFHSLANAYLSLGMPQKAKKLFSMSVEYLSRAKSEKNRAFTIGLIVQNMTTLKTWNNSELKQVEELIEGILLIENEKPDASHALVNLAILQAIGGQFQKATTTAKTITSDSVIKGWAFEGIGKAWARSGKAQAGLQWAKGLPSPWYQVRGMIGVANGMVKAASVE